MTNHDPGCAAFDIRFISCGVALLYISPGRQQQVMTALLVPPAELASLPARIPADSALACSDKILLSGVLVPAGMCSLSLMLGGSSSCSHVLPWRCCSCLPTSGPRCTPALH